MYLATLRLEKVTVRFRERKVLDSVTAVFEPGVHVVLGRNGAGKTTLLRAIANLVEFDGDILVDGRSVKSMSRRELARIIGYCWQNPYYGFIEETVEDEISVILENLGVEGDRRIIDILVSRELAKRSPYTLSGGEAKRVSLASVLVADQRVWLLDEPFSFLDRSGIRAVAELVEYGRSRGKTIVIALHDIAYADIVKPDSFLAIKDGRVAYAGSWGELTDEILASIDLSTRGEICGFTSESLRGGIRV